MWHWHTSVILTLHLLFASQWKRFNFGSLFHGENGISAEIFWWKSYLFINGVKLGLLCSNLFPTLAAIKVLLFQMYATLATIGSYTVKRNNLNPSLFTDSRKQSDENIHLLFFFIVYACQ